MRTFLSQYEWQNDSHGRTSSLSTWTKDRSADEKDLGVEAGDMAYQDMMNTC